MREREASAQEKKFINESIKEGFRLDERGIDDLRDIKISVGPEHGQALVHYGSTRYEKLTSVFANVSAEIVRPNPASPTEGLLRFHTEFSPMAYPALFYDKMSELETTLSSVLEKALRKSRAIDTEGLCIVAGEKVWSIRVDARVLDQNGNVLDCACLATMTALLHFRRPDVSLDGHHVIIVKEIHVASVHRKTTYSSICSSYSCVFDLWFV
jgi:exosome complex RNA-binding protein Rrp42 (RNase PH superfamily)